jgi:hypothetical protein
MIAIPWIGLKIPASRRKRLAWDEAGMNGKLSYLVHRIAK